MKAAHVGFFAVLALAAPALAAETNPIEKVLQMIGDLQTKIINEGQESQKMYDEFSEWCEDTSRNLHFEIKTGKAESAELQATIADQTAKGEALEAKIGELVASNAEDEAALKEATGIRENEARDFAAEDKELTETIDALNRAVNIIQREMQGGGASFAQLQGAQGVAQGLRMLVQASAVNSADGARLTALVQGSTHTDDSDSDEDAGAGAPDAAAYESKSGGIVEVLGNLLEKAEAQQATARKEESAAKNNYEMQKQSLDDAIKFAEKDMGEAKKSLAESKEKKAAATGDLDVTSKDLAEDTKSLADLHHDCMSKATAFEDETKSRGEELAAIAKAKQIIKEATGGAAEQSYALAQVSLLQVSSSGTGALHIIRKLAFAQKSSSLAQLATRIEVAMRSGSGDDVFAKIKGLIGDMLARLEDEAAADATEKAYCDKEMGETKAKKEEKEAELNKLTTKIDQKTAEAAKLTEQVTTLQKELGELAKAQVQMDELRQKEKALYEKNQPEMEQGLNGIKLALKVLKDYYSQNDTSGSGSASGIIGLLEVAESDFSKNLAEMVAEEEAAAAEYDTVTKENAVTKATKEKDVEFKSKEIASLKKAVAELDSDRKGVSDEYDAIMDYWKQIQKRCVAVAETYEERTARREAEIAGLQSALEILSNEAALLQKHSTHRTLRGSLRTHVA